MHDWASASISYVTACMYCSLSLVLRPPPFFCSSVCVQYNARTRPSAFVYYIIHDYTERKPKNKKRGRSGNEATVHEVTCVLSAERQCLWIKYENIYMHSKVKRRKYLYNREGCLHLKQSQQNQKAYSYIKITNIHVCYTLTL